MVFELAPRADLAELSAAFRGDHAVSIPGFLPIDHARQLHRELVGSDEWTQIFRGHEKVFEMPDAAFRALSSAEREKLDRLVMKSAREGLQYRYRAIRVSEESAERQQRGALADRFADFLNSAPVLSMLREITGLKSIEKVDAQATSYQAGHFLTSHDDNVEGKSRLAAYVYGLTPDWQPDWGGLLLLERGKEVRGFVPDFNVLRIFRVPQPHSVSCVAPWVGKDRISVTGWLRERAA